MIDIRTQLQQLDPSHPASSNPSISIGSWFVHHGVFYFDSEESQLEHEREQAVERQLAEDRAERRFVRDE